ncbi:hypothetical protein BFJ70_g645 [Fusarium oxysporum]|nr:hypothetical protein BFJ71_g363 [Fusarium oxysporum]RKL51931.1 hypothetical protein BFJ70_g645 [Fusarium oxysporum]
MLLFGNHVAKDWYHLVVRFMDYEATDPRDKIYALIGLADQTGYDIVADYSMPVLEVYRDFAVKMISVTKKLDILQYSTVQDLDAEKGWGPTTWILNVFKMLDEHKPVISRQNDGDLITWLLNSVTACSVPASMLTDFWEYLALAIARFMLMPNKNNEIKLLIKLLRLLAQASPPPLEWESILEEQHRQALRAVLVEIYDNEDEIDSALELIKLLRIRPHRNDNSFNNSVKEDRMFLITEDGYLGIGPKSMRPGDHVCVLYGGHTPFVLRPVRGAGDEEYLFLGESFVNGLMNGEILEDEGAVDKWFHLR